MSEMYDEDQPWHLTQEPEGQPSYEELADRIEELETKLEQAVEALWWIADDCAAAGVIEREQMMYYVRLLTTHHPTVQSSMTPAPPSQN